MSKYVLVFLLFNTVWSQDYLESYLPIFIINTNGLEIPDEPKITAQLGIINNDGIINKSTDVFNHYDGPIGIEIRGSSSQRFPKKQYSFETRDLDGEGIDVSLIGLPEEEDWILYAPYSDKTLLRNVLIYEISNQLGFYAPRTKFCEVIKNGEYLGLYVLIEKIKRDNNRVDINKLKEDEISGDDLTGGYMFKIDKKTGSEIDWWESEFEPFSGAWQRIFFQYDYPKESNIVEEQKTYIQEWVKNFETVAFSDYKYDTIVGYRRFLDLASAVNYIMCNEVSKNLEGYLSSFFMYKDKDSNDKKLHLGPIWDFNLSMGNNTSQVHWDTEGWRIEIPLNNWEINIRDRMEPFWIYTIWEDPVFKQMFYIKWKTERQTTLSIENINGLIDSWVEEMGDAIARNFEKWPTLGEYVWPNYFIFDNYEEEIIFLKQWLSDRILWIDSVIDEMNKSLGIKVSDNYYYSIFNYPNPFNPSTTIAYTIDKDSYVTIDIFDISGKLLVTLQNEYRTQGEHSVSWNGTDDSGSKVCAGVYFYQVKVGDLVETKKMVLVK